MLMEMVWIGCLSVRITTTNMRRLPLSIPARLVALAAAVLMCATLWVSGTHHHEADRGHSCAVCVAGHAPAVISTTIAAPSAPTVDCAAALTSAQDVLVRRALGIAPSRAPPLS